MQLMANVLMRQKTLQNTKSIDNLLKNILVSERYFSYNL